MVDHQQMSAGLPGSVMGVRTQGCRRVRHRPTTLEFGQVAWTDRGQTVPTDTEIVIESGFCRGAEEPVGPMVAAEISIPTYLRMVRTQDVEMIAQGTIAEGGMIGTIEGLRGIGIDSTTMIEVAMGGLVAEVEARLESGIGSVSGRETPSTGTAGATGIPLTETVTFTAGDS